jgi:BON domain
MEGGEMKNLWKGFVVASVGALLVLPQAMDTLAEDTKEKPKLKAERDPAQLRQRLEREVRHELVMLPYYDVFDNLTFRVDGSHVILSGQVVRPTLKSSAENVVKGIEGVEKVTNNIEVLPLS